MPDRDVFNRNVERGWQSAARWTYQGEDELAVPALLRQLGKALNNDGIPAINEICSIVVEVISSPDPQPLRQEAERCMEAVCQTSGSTLTEGAATAARRILADPDVLDPGSCSDRARLRAAIAKELVIDLAIRKISPPSLTSELIETTRMDIPEVLARRQHMRELLAAAPQLSVIATSVLQQPDGRLTKQPRVPTPKLPQETLVYMALCS